MPISIVGTSVPDAVEALELTIEAEASGFSRTQLQVHPDSLALAITVTDAGPDGHTRGPRGVRVVVSNPTGEDVAQNASYFQDGQLCILIEKPIEGTWKIEIEYGAAASVEINASSLSRGWMDKLRRGTHWFSCKTCKFALRTFVIATLLHLNPLVAAGVAAHGVAEVLAAIKPIVLDILTQTLMLEGGDIPHVFSIILDYIGDPVDRLLERICGWLRLC